MKKLMIAAAIVCAAVVGQAAQVAWACDWVYSLNDEKGVDTYMAGSTVSYWIVNMLSSTDTSGLGVDGSGNLVNSDGYAVVGSDVTAGEKLVGLGGGTAEGTIANGDYLAMVVYDADNGLYGVSYANKADGIVDEPGKPAVAGSLEMSFQNDGYTEGYLVATQAVPEPTSGLLLLLGVAGLALRRRRA